MTTLQPVTDASFRTEVLESDLPVLVDFWASWCPWCLQLTPVLEALATEYAGRVKIVSVNADENVLTASAVRVLGLPTLALFSGGEQVGSIKGATTRRVLAARLDQLVAAAPVGS
jgi:thioredoxin 1